MLVGERCPDACADALMGRFNPREEQADELEFQAARARAAYDILDADCTEFPDPSVLKKLLVCVQQMDRDVAEMRRVS